MDNALPEHCEVAIIGAGPCGLATAIELKRSGIADIIVIERAESAGGIPRHCGHSPFGMREFKRVYLGPAYVKQILHTAANLNINIFTGTTVTSIAEEGLLTLSSNQGMTQLRAKRVVLTTGTRETPRSARLIGGQRPLGITTTGALQSMVFLNRERPFSRPVIVGTELVSFSAIASCRHAGIKPVAMIDDNHSLTARSIFGLYPRALGIPILLGTKVIRLIGKQLLTGVEVKHANGETDILECDGVIFTGRFIPEASLARLGHLEIDPCTQGPVIDQFGRCSDPCYFAAGNVLRPVETAGWCWSEGRSIAGYVKESLSNRLPDARNQIWIGRSGEEISYIVPQKISLSENPHQIQGMSSIQLRFNRVTRGRLSLLAGKKEVYSRKIRSAPERRVLLPLGEPPKELAQQPLKICYKKSQLR